MGHAAVLTHHKATKDVARIQSWQIAALSTRAGWGCLPRLLSCICAVERSRIRREFCLRKSGFRQNRDVDGSTADAGSHLSDGGQQLLPQPNAGEGIWSQQLQLTIAEAAAARWPNERLKGGLRELVL